MTIRRTTSRRAFTLMELIIASSIMAVLLVAVQSTIMLAAHAAPGLNSRSTALVSSSAVLDLLNGDLAYASAFTARSATSVTFQVPDRNGDGLPDTITWAWDGTAGGNLSRTFNTNPATVVATGVQSFALAYDTRTSTTTGPAVTSAETLFSSASGIASNHPVDGNHYFGEYVRPTLPANALSWAVTRIQILASTAGPALGSTSIQVQTADPTDLPSGSALDSATMSESTLAAAAAWQTFTFSNASGISPQAGACIVASWLSDAQSANVQTVPVLLVTNTNQYLTTGDGGKTWNSSSGSALAHYVYGTYTTPGSPVTTYFVTGVRATLLTSTDNTARSRISIHVLNEPQVTGP